MVQRFKLTLEYDGTPFHGWQYQEGLSTVQGELERAVHAFSGEQREVYASGRTDAGVHAKGQIAHVDITKSCRAFQLMQGLNFHLRPHPIVVLDVEEVPADFHARFSSVWRQYQYRIVNRRAPLMLERNRAWWVIKSLDVQAMQQGANYLIGQHDFTSFRSTECQAASPIKHLDILQCDQNGDLITITARAPSFLHNQVRVMVGSLVNIGLGIWKANHILDVLAAKDRAAAGPTAPACGLYLDNINTH